MRGFVAAARTGIDPLPEPGPHEVPTLSSTADDKVTGLNRDGSRVYDYAQATVYLDVLTGRVTHYYDGSNFFQNVYDEDRLLPAKVSPQRALALLQGYYNDAGWPGAIVANRVQDHTGNNDRSVEIDYSPAVGGVPDTWADIAWVNREKGTLDVFSADFGGLPAPPASVTPTGTLEDVRRAALAFGAEKSGEAMAEAPKVPFRLVIWCPPVPSGKNAAAERRAFPAVVRTALNANRGILAYKGRILAGQARDNLDLVLDARTGEVLRADTPMFEHQFGGGAPPPGALTLSREPRSWRVATGGKGWNAWTSPVSTALVPIAAPMPGGDKVVLSDGKAAFPATYNPKTGLLGVSGKAYRPGPALADLLRRRVKG